MKNEELIVFLLTMGLLSLATLVPATASAQNAGLLATPVAGGGPIPAQNPQRQTFTGKITESTDGGFVFLDKSSNTTYQLDDQAMAEPFNGKNVKVTGTEDPANHIIHVVGIQEA